MHSLTLIEHGREILNLKSNKGQIVLLFATMVALLASLFAMPVAATSNPQPEPDQVITWPGDEANNASYWEQWLGDGWTCEKVDQEGSFTTDHFYGAIITKGGQWNNVFYDVPSGTHFAEVIRPDQPAAGISHYFKCEESEEPTPTPAPSNTPTPEPTKTPKPTLPPTDTFGQSSNTGSSSTGIIVVFAVLAMIAFVATMLAPAYGWRKTKK